MCTCKNYLGSVWFKKHVVASSQVIAYSIHNNSCDYLHSEREIT